MSVFNLLVPISKLLKVKKVDIYNTVFRLHTKLTVTILLCFCILVSANEYFGTPMDCVVEGKDPKSFVDNYCWINGTFTVPVEGAIGLHVSSFGVGSGKDHRRTYQLYYQWVNLILLGQAILFYIPAYLWKIWENDRLHSIANNLSSAIAPENYGSLRQTAVNYLSSNNKIEHSMYAVRFFVCELMNLLMIVVNMLMLEYVFDGFWFAFAPAVRAIFRNDHFLWASATARVFPKIAKCGYFDYGPSGSIQWKDFVCMLALNILNEKIFAFLWMWLIGLMIVSLLNVVCSTVCMASVGFRVKLLQAQVMSMNGRDVRQIANGATFGEWFFIHQLGRNVYPTLFRDIMEELMKVKRKTEYKI